MSLSLVKTKRKVSCLTCRTKKVRCDGGLPCIRCVNRNAPDQCTYSKPGQVGRPPKNAVVNKLVLNRTKATSSQVYKEFIFENVGYGAPIDSKFVNNDSSKNLYHFINSFFINGEAIMQLAVVRLSKAIPFLPDIKMYDLLEIFVWNTMESINVVITRIGALTLDNFSFFDGIHAAVFQDMALKFFSEPSPEAPLGNPLSTLSPQQAVHLIEAFFCISPHSLLLNKTLLLQGYWTDTIDPLLLCVVFGTTTYLSKLLNGQPVGLWEAITPDMRNPFLEYAYVLIQKSSSEVSLAKYQAVAVLGLFESVFGHIKRSISTIGLAYLIAENLGVVDGSFQARSNKVQAELSNNTLWAMFNSTVCGGINLGHIPRFAAKQMSLTLPPPTIEQSASYKFEEASGDARLFRGYYFLMESFYIQTVVCKFTSLILQQLPEIAYSMFRGRSKNSSLKRQAIGEPKPDDLEPRIRSFIQEFYDFIQNNKEPWSKQQTYTLEMVCTLYDIHVDFLKNIGPFVAGTTYANSAYDFFQDTEVTPDDPLTMTRVQQALPKVYCVMDKTMTFLSDPTNYNEKPLLLPRGLMVTLLETCTEVLVLKCGNNPGDAIANRYLKMVESLVNECIWKDWNSIETVRTKVKNYFELRNMTDNKDDSLKGGSASWDGGLELSMEDQLARVIFFDPCAAWVTTPMTSQAMDLQLLTNDDLWYDKNVPDIMVEPVYNHGSIFSDEGTSMTPESYSTSPAPSINEALYMPFLTDPTSAPSSTSPVIQQILFGDDPFV